MLLLTVLSSFILSVTQVNTTKSPGHTLSADNVSVTVESVVYIQCVHK